MLIASVVLVVVSFSIYAIGVSLEDKPTTIVGMGAIIVNLTVLILGIVRPIG